MAKSMGCYGCKDRHPNCHADCERYAEYRKELEKAKPDTDQDYMSYRNDRISKTRRRK